MVHGSEQNKIKTFYVKAYLFNNKHDKHLKINSY